MQEYLFGDLLKTLRKMKHLSQQALADKLGVHRNTIWSWEQGVYLPDSKGMVLELARLLDLDEPETRQLLEASLTTVSSYWNVPFARNPFFTGREQVLH
jgi:transcriptional regulator with XRE-family HTH domain